MTSDTKSQSQPKSPARQAASSGPPGVTPRQLEDNTLAQWLSDNKLFLGLLGAAIVVFGVLQVYLPKRAKASQEESWATLYDTVQRQSAVNLSPEKLPATLASLEDDQRIFPFAVLTATADALTDGDRESLATLKPQLEKLLGEEQAEFLRVHDGQQSEAEARYLLSKVEAELNGPAPMTFENPEPTGPRVKLTVKVGELDSYELTYGLYTDAAPEASARFLAAVEGGMLDGQEGKFAGVYNMRFDGLAADAESAEPLPLEKEYGYFHLEGVLSTIQRSAGAMTGEQEGHQFALFLREATYFDGRSTVFAKLIGSEEALAALQALQPSPTDPSQPSQPVQIVSAELQ